MAPGAVNPLRGAALLIGLGAIGYGLSHAGLRPGTGSAAPGQLTFVLTAAALCAIGLPRQAACFAAGFSFGAARGVGLAMLAQLLGCCLSFFWARLVAHDAAQRLLGRQAQAGGWRAWLLRADGWMAHAPFSTTLILRLVPVGNNLLLNLVAGVSRTAFLPFLAASAIGYVPQTLVFALAGSGVHVDRGLEMALGGALFVLSGLLGVLAMRRLPR